METKWVRADSFWTKFALYGLSEKWDFMMISTMKPEAETTSCDLFWGLVWGTFKAFSCGLFFIIFIPILISILVCVGIMIELFWGLLGRYVPWDAITFARETPYNDLASEPIKFLKIRGFAVRPVYGVAPVFFIWLWQYPLSREILIGWAKVGAVAVSIIACAAVLVLIFMGCRKLCKLAAPWVAEFKAKHCRPVEFVFQEQSAQEATAETTTTAD